MARTPGFRRIGIAIEAFVWIAVVLDIGLLIVGSVRAATYEPYGGASLLVLMLLAGVLRELLHSGSALN